MAILKMLYLSNLVFFGWILQKSKFSNASWPKIERLNTVKPHYSQYW